MQEETGKEECSSFFFVKLSVVAFDTNYSGRVLVGKFSDESFLRIFFFLSVSALNRSIVQKQVYRTMLLFQRFGA